MKQLPDKCVVYAITNLRDGMVYIGSSINIRARMVAHFVMLKRGNHDNPHLQRAFLTDGITAFDCSVVELCSIDERLLREQHYLDALRSYVRSCGYNVCPAARGNRHSDETRAKLSQIAKNRSPESLERYAAGSRGKIPSLETRAKMGAARRGRKHSPEAVAKIAASNRRRTLSAETKAKIGEANRHPSEETRAKMSAHRKGKPMPWRDKIAQAMQRPEVLAKLRKPRSKQKGTPGAMQVERA